MTRPRKRGVKTEAVDTPCSLTSVVTVRERISFPWDLSLIDFFLRIISLREFLFGICSLEISSLGLLVLEFITSGLVSSSPS